METILKQMGYTEQSLRCYFSTKSMVLKHINKQVNYENKALLLLHTRFVTVENRHAIHDKL